MQLEQALRASIREIPDFPKPGINFYDITTALKEPKIFSSIIETLAHRYQSQGVDAVVGMESRGFIFAAPLAVALNAAFIPVRKFGKLPAKVESATYLTEYSEDTLEIHRDALSQGHKAVIVDDLIATGGTAVGTVELVSKLGAEVHECAFVLELEALRGREKLAPTPVVSLLRY